MGGKAVLYVIERLLTMITGLGAFVLLARHFGPANLGLISTVQSASAALLFMVTLGLDRYIVKSLVETAGERLKVVISASTIRFSGWIIYSFFLIGAVWLINPVADMFMLALVEMFTVFLVNVIVIRYVMEAEGKAYDLTLSLIISRVVGIAYLFTAVLLNWELVIAFLFLPLQSFIRLVCMLVFTRNFSRASEGALISRAWIVENVKKGFPIMVSGAIFPLFMQADVLMIAHFYTEKEVGLYSAPMKIIIQIGFVGVAVMAAFFPLIVAKYKNDMENFHVTVSTVARFLFLFSLVVTFVLFSCSEFLVDILFGSGYEDSKPVLAILSIISFFLITSKLYSSLLIVHDLARFEVVKAIVAVIMNLGLNFVLIPKYSIVGAAVASLISYMVADFLFYFLFSQLSCVRKAILDSFKGAFFPRSTLLNFFKIKEVVL